MLYGWARPRKPRVGGQHMLRKFTSAAHGLIQTVLLVGFVFALAPAAAGQSVSGTILGTVTDSSGAVISKAKVIVTNEGTGLTRTVEADSNGDFAVPSIPTG